MANKVTANTGFKADKTTHIVYINYVLLPDGKLEHTEDSLTFPCTLNPHCTFEQMMDACETMLAGRMIETYAIHPLNALPTIL